MLDGTRAGRIEVIAGVMFSGKSEELIRRVRRAVIAKKHVQVFKSHLDARYAGLYSISTHDGGIVEAEPIDSSDEIMSRRRPETQRSEEHTSELQSQSNLVCRLLLEKKKKSYPT